MQIKLAKCRFSEKISKKIRSLKAMSQQAFAEVFGLKRATLGAYEEGRSEPKIDTIIKIANHFSIKVDDLLTSELTVNQLLKFKGDLITNSNQLSAAESAKIPYITSANIQEYITHFDNSIFIKDLPKLELPLNLEYDYRGFTVQSLEMSNHDSGYFPNDIVIGKKGDLKNIKKLANGTLVFILVKTSIIFRRLYILDRKIILRAFHKNVDDEKFLVSEIKEFWIVKSVFYKRVPEFSSSLENEVQRLVEREMNKRD